MRGRPGCHLAAAPSLETSRHSRVTICPSFASASPQNEGAENAGCPLHPKPQPYVALYATRQPAGLRGPVLGVPFRAGPAHVMELGPVGIENGTNQRLP